VERHKRKKAKTKKMLRRTTSLVASRQFGQSWTLQKCCPFSTKSLLNLKNLDSFREGHKEFLELAKTRGEGTVQLVRKDRILELTFSNKPKKNAISGRMMYELCDHLGTITKEIEKNDDLLALVIRGDGDEAFASGADLKFVSECLNNGEKGLLMSKFMTPVMNTLRDCPLLVICYLNGFVIGGGAEVATVGDFRIMTDTILPDHSKPNFVQFIHARIGASPGWGGGGRLTQIVGRRNALKLFGTSQRVSAKEALGMGLVDMIHERKGDGKSQTADEVIQEFLKPYLDQPYPKSVRSVKRIIAASDPASQENSENMAYNEFRNRWCSEDNLKALTANKPSKK
jgi:ethylmalonyl-CoA/methylmalonyl-CoA decarboxylase